jgi:uncharacterized protein (TIRG00374 family)
LNTSFSKFLKIGIPLGLGVFLIWYSYSRFSPEQLSEIVAHFKNANYGFILLGVLLSLLSHILRAYRWNYLLEPLGFQPKILNNFMAVNTAYIMNLFIPKSGEVTRAIVINKYENIPFDKAFGTIISERVVDVVVLFLVTLIALILKFDILYDFLFDLIPLNKLYYIAGVILIIGILFLAFMKYSKSNFKQKLINFFSGFKDGVLSIIRMKRKQAFLIQTIVIWGLYILSFYVSVFALEDTATISFGTIIITFVIGSFAFAFTNSGFGSYPFAIAAILLVFGIPETVGTAFGWIVWTSNIASIIFFGGLSFIMLPIYNRKIK